MREAVDAGLVGEDLVGGHVGDQAGRPLGPDVLAAECHLPAARVPTRTSRWSSPLSRRRAARHDGVGASARPGGGARATGNDVEHVLRTRGRPVSTSAEHPGESSEVRRIHGNRRQCQPRQAAPRECAIRSGASRSFPATGGRRVSPGISTSETTAAHEQVSDGDAEVPSASAAYLAPRAVPRRRDVGASGRRCRWDDRCRAVSGTPWPNCKPWCRCRPGGHARQRAAMQPPIAVRVVVGRNQIRSVSRRRQRRPRCDDAREGPGKRDATGRPARNRPSRRTSTTDRPGVGIERERPEPSPDEPATTAVTCRTPGTKTEGEKPAARPAEPALDPGRSSSGMCRTRTQSPRRSPPAVRRRS